jgi:hypothetical protein
MPQMVATVEPPISIARLQWLDFRDHAHYAIAFSQLRDAIDHNRLDSAGAQARVCSQNHITTIHV